MAWTAHMNALMATARREHLDGIGIQLVEDTREDGLSKAEEEIASALSLPEYPTANEQRRQIEERAAALYAGEIPIPEQVVDEILRDRRKPESQPAPDHL